MNSLKQTSGAAAAAITKTLQTRPHSFNARRKYHEAQSSQIQDTRLQRLKVTNNKNSDSKIAEVEFLA